VRVDGLEVEFSGDQEDNRPDSGERCEATSTAFGCLEQAVDSFQESIGLACLCPRRDTLQIRSNHLGDHFHWFNLGAHHTLGALSDDGLVPGRHTKATAIAIHHPQTAPALEIQRLVPLLCPEPVE